MDPSDCCYFGLGYGVESVGLLLLRGGYGGGQDFGRLSDASMAVGRTLAACRMQVGRAVSRLLLLRRRYGVDSVGLLQSDVSRGC